MDGKRPRKGLRVLAVMLGTCALAFLMLYMAGVFVPHKIDPGTVASPKPSWRPKDTVTAVRETVSDFYEAPGTVRPRRETRVAARVRGRIVEILVSPGDPVKSGDRLVVLDSRELRTRLEGARQAVLSARARRDQARQGVKSAEAGFTRARAAYQRVQKYFKAEAATKQRLEEAEAAFQQAQAGLRQARESLKEAEAGIRQAEKAMEGVRIVQDYTVIQSDADGEVVKRLAEPGDMAFPGKPLIVLQTRGALRLEALVPEGIIDRVKTGEILKAGITALDRTLKGPVAEIVPSADPSTRSFLVKLDLPVIKGLYPGMFGRLLVPVGQVSIVWIPGNALRRVGQLEMVTTRRGDRWVRVYVTTGRSSRDRVEILSGLNGGEEIALSGDAP